MIDMHCRILRSVDDLGNDDFKSSSTLFGTAEDPLSDKSPQGILVDHHQGSDGSDYVRFVFGKRPKGMADWKMDDALDAEFLFLAGRSADLIKGSIIG